MATGCVAVRVGGAADDPLPLRGLGPPSFPGHQATVKASPNFISSDLFTPFSAPRTTLPSIAKFVRPSYGKTNPWGVVTTSYGGVGPAVDEVKETGAGSTSRSHRHYGTGCTNFYAPEQPYNVTDLSLSQCRPCDQLLPKPLLTNRVLKRQLQERYPKNGVFTSHESKFGMFPAATSTGKQDLTPRTARALCQLHSDLYCTSTYNEDFGTHNIQQREKITNRCVTHPLSTSTLRAGATTASVGSCDSPMNTDIGGWASEEGRIDGPGKKEIVPSKEAGDDVNLTEEITSEDEFNTTGSAAIEEQGTLGEKERDADTEGESHQFAERWESDEDEDGGVSFTEKSGDSEKWQVPSECPEMGYTTFTHLPQLPDNFRRITSKYTRNQSSPPWPCVVPNYLLCRHSLLPSSITALSDTLSPRSKSVPTGVDTAVDNVDTTLSRMPSQGLTDDSEASDKTSKTRAACSPSPRQSSGGSMPKIVENNRGRLMASPISANPWGATEGRSEIAGRECKLPRLKDNGDLGSRAAKPECVAGGKTVFEAKAQRIGFTDEPREVLAFNTTANELQVLGDIPTLSSLVTPSGTRVPHRLGLRYKTEAHRRFHMLYPDPVPDLRESRTSGKKYFFYDYHASAFRG